MVYAININSVLQIDREIDAQKRKLEHLQTSAVNVKNRCSSGNYRTIRLSLNSILNDIQEECTVYDSMTDVLSQSTLKYKGSEEELVQVQSSEITSSSIVHNEEIAQVKEEGIVGWSDLWESTAGLSGAGGFISSVFNLVTASEPKDYVLSGNYFIEATGEAAVAISKGSDAGWKYLLGFGDDAGQVASHGFKSNLLSAFDDYIDDFKFSSAKGKAGNYSTATKWAGNILTFAANGFENYDEMESGDISGGRAVAETVLESATDIAVGAGATVLVTAGAGAIMAAAGVTVALPAIAIGAGAAVITVGANAVCKWVTGKFFGESKDLGEVVADTVCDVGEGAIKIAKKAGKAAKDTITSAWKGICGAFSW